MKIYISGKITGLPMEVALANFRYYAYIIKETGNTAINPMELPHKHNKRWESFMKEDIAALMSCDAIIIMDNYQNSKGARLELDLAMLLDIKIFFSIPQLQLRK